MSNASQRTPSPDVGAMLRGLRDTLRAEREALIENDAEALLRISESKSRELQRLNDLNGAALGKFDDFGEDLRALAELNVANGALIARRRSETIWTLRQLGLYESDSAYNERGAFGAAIKSRRGIRA